LHVDIRRCADNLVAFQDERLEHTTDGQGPIIEQNAAQLAQLDAGYQFGPQEHFPFRGQHLKILTLDQVLERYPSTAFILDIHSNTIDIHKQVIEAVERHQADQRVLIQSDHDVILSSIKELRPMWLFGTGTRDLTRSHLLTSVFLASMAPLLGDVLIAPMQIRGHDVVQEDLIREVHRRHKKFFVSDVDDPNTLTHLRQLGVDGVISNRPAAIWPLFKQNL
jgi:glycerophosphoryl diester phosphodiesterase